MTGQRKGIMGVLTSFSGIAITIAGALLGVLFGIAIFTFGYAGGWAYLGSDPATCNQCHAMNEQYNGWLKGSHKNAATCNDCHSPHDNIIHKYLVKGENGFRHALMFTTGAHPENIRITEGNLKVTNSACMYCHADLVGDINMTRTANEQVNCVQCHSDVGHM